MKDTDFPALYQDADLESRRVQALFKFAVGSMLLCSTLAALAVVLPTSERVISLLQTALFIGVLGSALYLALGRPQKVWYGTRALAESIKTLSWRYIVRASPFNGTDDDARREFSTTVRKLLESDVEAAALRFNVTSSHLISARMRELRASSLQTRVNIYVNLRINDQLTWYRTKARENRLGSTVWHLLMILLSILALGSSLLRVAFPTEWMLPVDAVTALPTSALAWLQSKRYQELSSSYALTAHEIAILSGSVRPDFDEAMLAAFVSDAESAFSREHTQWQARRDEA